MLIRYRKHILARRLGHRLHMTEDQYRRIDDRIRELFRSDRRARCISIIGGATIGLLGPLTFFATHGALTLRGVPTVRSALLAAVIMVVLSWITWFIVFDRLLRRPTRQALRDCGYPICIACGYPLNDLTTCPECGHDNDAMNEPCSPT